MFQVGGQALFVRQDNGDSSGSEAPLRGVPPGRAEAPPILPSLALLFAVAVAVAVGFRHEFVVRGSTSGLRSAVGLFESKDNGNIHHRSPKRVKSPKVPLCSQIPHLDLTDIVQNNLAGAGPDEGEEGIWFSAFDQKTQKHLYLVMNAHSDYEPQASWENGLSENRQFGTINLKPDSSVDVSFRALDKTTKEDIVLPGLFLTFYDLDTGVDGETAEYVSTKTRNVHVASMISPLSEVQRKDSEDGREIFWGTQFGTGEDNPEDPHQLTAHQRARTVTFFYTNFAGANVTLGSTGGELPRYFYFSASPVTRCANDRFVNKTWEEQVMAAARAANATKRAEEAANKSAREADEEPAEAAATEYGAHN